MSRWKAFTLVGLLALALGLGSVDLSEPERVAVELTAAGVFFALFVACYVWWKMMAAVTRVVFLAVAAVGVALLLNRWGVVGG